jgi:hypothetical protein
MWKVSSISRNFFLFRFSFRLCHVRILFSSIRNHLNFGQPPCYTPITLNKFFPQPIFLVHLKDKSFIPQNKKELIPLFLCFPSILLYYKV